MALWKPDKDANTADNGRGVPLPPGLRQANGAQPQQQGRAAAQPAARTADKSSVSVIGSDLTIIGNLISKGEVQVDGEVQGDIHGSSIVVGERARITGGLIAEEITVRGQVMGTLRGNRVALQSSSKVEGDIYHQSLAIEQGAYFEGKSRRTEDPTAGMQLTGLPEGSHHYNGGSQ